MSVYTFRIAEAFTTATIPMARLAEYMAEVAKLIGEPEHVHFEKLVDGSVRLLADVEPSFVPSTRTRLALVQHNQGPTDAMRALERLDEMLARDDATGELLDAEGAVIIPFPGKNRPAPIIYGQLKEEGTLEGEIFRIGGKDATIHVNIRDGETSYSECVTTKEIARTLAPYLLGPTIRLHGQGTWLRHTGGEWELKNFRIDSFEVLDDRPLAELVRELREVAGNEWDREDDPLGTVLSERGSDPQDQGGRH